MFSKYLRHLLGKRRIETAVLDKSIGPIAVEADW
jgi:hypothetical protein